MWTLRLGCCPMGVAGWRSGLLAVFRVRPAVVAEVQAGGHDEEWDEKNRRLSIHVTPSHRWPMERSDAVRAC